MSQVLFRVLGTLAAERDGCAIALGGNRQRALLALLLIHADEAMSAERLVEELWGEPTPPRAVKRLQVAITRLRRALTAGDADALLVSDAAGYRLRPAPGQLDAERFGELVAEGRHALEDRQHERAAGTLREALGLWRGEAYADVAFESFAQWEIARLHELRVAAIEDRVEADLALGRHHELVPDLERLVAEHPLRERMRGQLMLSLYRAGRQAHALESFQDARRLLVTELGLEPGPALRRLQHAILVADPALDPPTPAAGAVLDDERKPASMLVVDLGWAATVENDSERLHAAAAKAAAAAREEVAAAGGSIARAGADAIVAAFGAPAALEDHAERALAAAIAVRERLAAALGDALTLRLGAETGEILVGPAGNGEPSITGAAVNVAGRLARNAAAGEIRLGERIATTVRGAFEVRGAGETLVLAGPRTRPTRPVARTFVGRGLELERLRAISARVALDGRPHLITVVGDAGVGKTSLLAAFQERSREVRWLTGRCPPWGRAVTYRPLGDHLRSCLGLAPDAAPEVVTARLAGREDLAPLLGLPAAPELEAWEVKARLRRAWVAFLEEIRAAGPVTLIVEDLHWAEDALLDLLASTVRDVNGPLLVVATARPELIGRRGGWGEDHAIMSTIRLEPLSRAEAERMLAELTGGVPAQARDAILARAEGSPLFVEELLQSFIDGGILRREDGRWTVTGPPDRAVVPPTVQAVLAARIDRLPGLEKRALQAASVVGRAFSDRAVCELVGAEPAFGLLEQRDFVRRRPTGEREHVFKHELTRAVAYASLSSARRARLHAAFAGWLEAQDPGGDRHAPVLAHHYAEAAAPTAAELAWGEDPGALAALRISAVRWLRRAGEQAAGRHEMNDAAALFRQATGFEAAGAARADLWRSVARASEQAFGMDGYRDALEHVIELTPPGTDRGRLYADLAFRGSNPATWSRPPARETVERWIAHALDEAGTDAAARARTLLARTTLDPATTGSAAEEALAIARMPGHGWLLGPAYRHLAHCATAVGALEEARRWVDRELAVPPEFADRSERSLWFLQATFAYLRTGRIAEARRFAREHEAFASRLSPHHRMHAAGAMLLLRTVTGDWDEAGRLVAEAEAAAAANRDTLCDLNWRAPLMAALVVAQLGAEGEARRLETAAAQAIPAHASLGQEPALLRLVLLRNDLDEAQRLLDADPGPYVWTDVDYVPARLDGLAAVGDLGQVEAEAPFVLRAGGYGEPFALRALGRVRDDPALVARAAERFAAMGLEWHARETRALLTEVTTAR